ncbi:MAG: sodium:calcium exchanger [Spirulina sp. SIO3F2]|nr:sodium:calcium exchanger [Spirulina sp. SIO3F2]
MATELTLIAEMATVMGAATLGGCIASRLRQPVLLGYLLGGMLIGPTGLGWITLESDIKVLAELGVALLLFALGVEFSLKDLLRLRKIALGGGTLQIVLTLLLGSGLVYAMSWVETVPSAVFLGAVLSLSSTAVVLKTLIERNEVQTTHGQIMLAMLIVQDLGLGIMLAVLPTLAEPLETMGMAIVSALLKLLLFLGLAVLLGSWLIPTVIRMVARQGSQELFLLSIVALCLGIALLTSVLGLGIEMGAFVAGLMIANIEYADHALDRVLPMRDVFATLFFASIGLLIDPRFLLDNLWVLLGLVSVTMLGKAILVTAIVRLFGYSLKTALTVGTGINQIGEFSFVLANVALGAGLFSDRIYGLTVGTTAATLLLTPWLLKLAPVALRVLARSPRTRHWFGEQNPQLVGIQESELRGHVIVAGFGRVGQTLMRMLYFQGHPMLVIDNNEAVLQILRDRQIPYLFGDASSDLVLEKARVRQAKAMAITLPDPMATRLTLNRALYLAPELNVTVRAHQDDEIETLYRLGAQEVVQPEFEAALEMGAHILLNLNDPTYLVQQVVNRYRSRRYRDIVPERAEYWGISNLERSVEGLAHHWYVLESGNPLVGQSITAANLRRHTGVSIMALEREKKVIRYPVGSLILDVGDRLLVVGSPEEQVAFDDWMRA